MTIDEALEAAKKYIDPTVLPQRSTLYGWIKTGALSPPIKRENSGKKGGMKDIFPTTLPCEIAVVSHLKNIERFNIKEIAAVKKLIETGNDEDVLKLDMMLRVFNPLMNMLYYYLNKTKAGIPINVPATVTMSEEENGEITFIVAKSKNGRHMLVDKRFENPRICDISMY